MPIPTPNLDNRKFQDIVDHAKRLIPHYCPEWTDHNVSDPGVAIIELFAWMTELSLYRVNQVPDKMYLEFLNLIGVQLEPPRAARTPITFYLSSALENDLVIPEGTEVATVRTETSPAIVFSTESKLTIKPPKILSTMQHLNQSSGDSIWVPQDLARLTIPGEKISLFGLEPKVSDAFYFAFESDHSNHVFGFEFNCEVAGGAGIDPLNPPLEWQVWQGPISRWAKCIIDHDGTGGFNYPGEVILNLPSMAEGTFQGLSAYWLRLKLNDQQSSPGGYKVSPEIRGVTLSSKGAAVSARHATTVVNEFLGQSDGTPGQTFRLRHFPVLPRNPELDFLSVVSPGGEKENWTEVDDFGDSKMEDAAYTLDAVDGLVTLPPTLVQPDGHVYRFGKIPPKGSALRFTRYQYGGGTEGNIPPRALTVIKSPIPFVSRAINYSAALGGADPQSIEDAKLRVPSVMRTRSRAVTADDFEYLAKQVEGVGRVHCLAPTDFPSSNGNLVPGEIKILVLPRQPEDKVQLNPEDLSLSADVRSGVINHLDSRKIIGTKFDVTSAQFVWLSAKVKLKTFDPQQNLAVKDWAERELYRYLNPYTGGPRRTGWPFGRDLHISELFGILQSNGMVEYVEDIKLDVVEPGSSVTQPAPHRLTIPMGAVVVSGHHTVQTI